jgi:hypothetical protein
MTRTRTPEGPVKVLHGCGLLPDSSGLQRTFCGRRLALTADNFRVAGEEEPPRWRWCKRCLPGIRARRRRFGGRG